VQKNGVKNFYHEAHFLMKIIKTNFLAFAEIVEILLRHAELTITMAKREISDRYVGQTLGVIWAIGHPIFMIGIYIFVFVFVFKVKIGNSVDLPLDYTTYILAGLVPWLSMQELIVKSCTVITSNSSLVKQVVFPLEILPVKSVLASLVPQIVAFAILFVYVLATTGGLWLTYVLLPLLFFFQILIMMGIAFFLSAIGAYFRDLKDVMQLFSVCSIYLLPIFYIPNMVPDVFRSLIYLNPFSYMVWCYQDVIYFGYIAHPVAWVIFPAMSVITFVLGYRLFRKLKNMLAGVV
jgi:lipopolysaccharide transport system permease protein